MRLFNFNFLDLFINSVFLEEFLLFFYFLKINNACLPFKEARCKAEFPSKSCLLISAPAVIKT